MSRYSPEFKEQIIRKLMPPHNRTVASVSRETGVSSASLYNWKKQFRAQGHVVPKKPTIADHWDGKTKLAAVIQTAALNEAERSEYCRKHGLYPEQLEAWKAEATWLSHRLRCGVGRAWCYNPQLAEAC